MAEISSREQFDRQATHYNAQWNQWSEASLRWLLEHADARPEHRLLDVATGTGFTALAFAPHVARVVGADVSTGMLTQARKQAAGMNNIEFGAAAAEALPFADAAFDLVTCRVASHHFHSIPQFAAEAFRVLRPGGRLLIADTTIPDEAPEVEAWQNRVERLRDRSHMRNCSPAEWRTMVEQTGFVVEQVDTCPEANPITLRAWLAKGGCEGEAAQEVERMFADAPEGARRAFDIRTRPDGDTSFNWMRVVLAARKPA